MKRNKSLTFDYSLIALRSLVRHKCASTTIYFKDQKRKSREKLADKKYIMKIALLASIASLAHIGVYLLIHQADLIPQEYNAYTLWAALGLTFACSFFVTLKQSTTTNNR